MATYKYVARKASGEEVAGAMQADNPAAVVRALDERNLFPVKVNEQEAPRGALGRRRIGAKDLSILYGQLSDLLGAGVPALRALDTLGRSIVNKRLAALVRQIRERVAAGASLADAMAQQPDVFTTLHVAMVRAGEQGGFLEQVLANLSAFLERQDELRNKVLGAMVYPLLVMTVGLVIGTALLIFLVPQFKAFFEGLTVPLPTRMLFRVSDVFANFWPLMLLVVLIGASAVWGFVRSDRGRRAWDVWRLKMPVLGRILRLVAITRFCRILGMMLEGGVPLLDALTIAKDATGSLVLAETIGEATENVRAGETLAAPLGESGYFPAEILEMIAVAEESNQLERTLLQIADTVERRTNRQVDLGVRLIEPMILVMLAAGIGVFAVALVYPIFSMAGSIQ
ncbi:MAG: type II secretion system F family protein [Planctomycetes bacterium]|nr:type II secretion system F family protein [Planctomycetota bacterium]